MSSSWLILIFAFLSMISRRKNISVDNESLQNNESEFLDRLSLAIMDKSNGIQINQ